MLRHGLKTILASAFTLMVAMSTAAADQPADTNWLTYNRTANGQRYAPLAQINADNAAELKEVCRVQVAETGSFQTSPLEIDGTLFVTTPHDTLAIDASDCEILWRNVYQPEQREVYQTNRGVAYANGHLFRGTPDGRLLSIDAKTGKTIWQEQIANPLMGEFVSAAPAVWEGLIIVGTAGGDWGARGRVMGFDQATGREVWRFNTIPTGDEPGADSWKNSISAHHGGGGTWTTYTVNMATGQVYIPVGNPAPDLLPHYRPGANLYTNSVVVLDARTGELDWYYQLSPHDGHDLDLGAAPTLYWSSDSVPMLALAGKDGHIYGVSRRSHEARFRTAITTIKNEGVTPTPKGVHVCPGPLGGTEWNGVAYDRKNHQLIAPTVDWCATLTASKDKVEYRPGEFYFGGTWQMDPKPAGWLNAVNPDTGEILWRYHADSPMVAGVTPTAGGVTFTGDMAGNFLVFDSVTGKLLLKSPTGGSLAGGVITYRLDGRQYVALTSGNVSRLTFAKASGGHPSILVYALPKTGD
ncbi:MAG: PQQ-binding-like beta-propeller repeat protein [Salinisphaera sp.]|nr:PQQ-binding-like beta-propeller repeat protein [Salinisphaera sp.]